jgi:YfiH family protein
VLHQERNGLKTYHFESLVAEGLVHAVFTRLGGTSQGPFASLNVGNGVGDDEAAVVENHRRIYAHLDLSAGQVSTAVQVHGNRVALVGGGDGGQLFPNTDGLVTGAPGVALLLRFADCQPILLYDPQNHALGLAHAGWRGVAQGIARRTIEAMQASFGSEPGRLIAGLGPAIGACCYTVGHDVAAAMGYALPDWSQVMHLQDDETWAFDISAANAQQLAAAGVKETEHAQLCTACHSDEFFSHRADGGRTGRFAVVAYLEPGTASRGTHSQKAAGVKRKQISRPADSLSPPGLPTFEETLGGKR